MDGFTMGSWVSSEVENFITQYSESHSRAISDVEEWQTVLLQHSETRRYCTRKRVQYGRVGATVLVAGGVIIYLS